MALPIPSTPLREDFGLLLEGDGSSVLDLDPEEVVALFQRHGLLLFRGFDVDVEAFRRFSDRFGEFRAHGGVFPPREDVDRDGAIQTVEAGTMDIPPHCELRWGPFSPEVVFFYCASPAQKGGETTVYDGQQIAARLGEKTRSRIAGRNMLYRHRSPPVYDWRKMLGAQTPEEAGAALERLDNSLYGASHRYAFEEDTLALEYTIPFLTRTKWGSAPAFASGLLSGYGVHASFEDGSPIPLDLKRELYMATEGVVVLLKWQARDFAMIDNTRVMHGRRGWSARDTGRRIYTRFGQARF